MAAACMHFPCMLASNNDNEICFINYSLLTSLIENGKSLNIGRALALPALRLATPLRNAVAH